MENITYRTKSIGHNYHTVSVNGRWTYIFVRIGARTFYELKIKIEPIVIEIKRVRKFVYTCVRLMQRENNRRGEKKTQIRAGGGKKSQRAKLDSTKRYYNADRPTDDVYHAFVAIYL